MVIIDASGYGKSIIDSLGYRVSDLENFIDEPPDKLGLASRILRTFRRSPSATYLSQTVTSIGADLPSVSAPTARVDLRISRFQRSMELLVRVLRQCLWENLV